MWHESNKLGYNSKFDVLLPLFFDTRSLDGQLQTSSQSTCARGFEGKTKDMTDSFTLVILHQGQLVITKSIT